MTSDTQPQLANFSRIGIVFNGSPLFTGDAGIKAIEKDIVRMLAEVTA